MCIDRRGSGEHAPSVGHPFAHSAHRTPMPSPRFEREPPGLQPDVIATFTRTAHATKARVGPSSSGKPGSNRFFRFGKPACHLQHLYRVWGRVPLCDGTRPGARDGIRTRGLLAGNQAFIQPNSTRMTRTRRRSVGAIALEDRTENRTPPHRVAACVIPRTYGHKTVIIWLLREPSSRGGTRTHNPTVNSRVHCQLCYSRM